MARSRNEVLREENSFSSLFIYDKKTYTNSYTHRAVVKMTLLLNNTPLQSGSIPFRCIIYGIIFPEFPLPHISATLRHD